ncbi:MAG: methionine synthase [Chloroflexota bacterium]
MNSRGDLPLLPTSVVGSYALPSWFHLAKEHLARGDLGVTDIREFEDDGVALAILDQERAGIDVVSDGEMRRHEFLAGFLRTVGGLRQVPTPRRIGEPGLDDRPHYETVGPLHLPDSLGLVEEYRAARAVAERPLKVTIPGPFAFSAHIVPVDHYSSRLGVAEEFVGLINAELRAVVHAGAEFVQVDEPVTPGQGEEPYRAADLVRLVAATLEGVVAKRAMHVCFGAYKRLTYAKRTYRPYFPRLLDAPVDQFVLEFANREMSEIDLFRDLGARELGAGVIDVRSWYRETPEDVAEMVRACLAHVPADKLWLNPDCGLRRMPRGQARAKLAALAAGVRPVRQELEGKVSWKVS